MKRSKKPNLTDELDIHSSKSIQLYGSYLGGDPGCQDYTKSIKLEGVRIVDEEFLLRLINQRDELLAALEMARNFIGEQTVRTDQVGNKVYLRDNLPKITNTLASIEAAIAKAKAGAL